jgi:predicted nuclease of predicted toxin-antitoxin system
LSRPPDLRILLDENLDWRLERDLPGHEVKSVPRIGWAGIENGELIDRAQREFDVLITMDSRMTVNVRNTNLVILVLKTRSNRLADTRSLMTEALKRLPTLAPGSVTSVPG